MDPLSILDGPADVAGVIVTLPPGAAISAPPSTVAEATPPPVPAPSPSLAVKRPTLFDLEAEMLELTIALDDGETITAEVLARLAERFHEVDDAIDRKVEGWARWIRQLEVDAETAQREAKRLAKRAGAYEDFAERLREKLKDAMIRIGKERVKTALLTVSVRACPPSVASVSIPDLPTRYLRPPAPPEPDKSAILAAWRASGAGTPESPRHAPPGVVIREDGRTLQIK